MNKQRSSLELKIFGQLTSLRLANMRCKLFLAFIILFPLQLSFGQVILWEFDDLITDVRESGARLDVIQDRFGNFYSSHWQPESDRLVYGTRFISTNEWEFQLIDSAQSAGYESAIAINELGHAHIAYFVNKGNRSFLSYATNTTGTFEITAIQPDSSWGLYGPSPDLELTTQASIDIIILENGQPAIIFFDRRFDEENIVNCDFNSRAFPVYTGDYQLNMKLFVRQESGNWIQPAAFEVPYEATPQCLLNTGNIALAPGDRFGEFCQFGQTSDGRTHIFTTSTHNHQLLLWSSTDAGLSDWDLTVIDSVSRVVQLGNRDFRLAFDFIDVVVDTRNVAHLVYGMADLFGLVVQGLFTNASDPANRSFFYTRVALDSLADTSYQVFHHNFNPSRDRRYRSNYSISVAGEDSVIISHYDVSSSEIIYHISPDRGLSWEEGTLVSIVTNSPIQSEVKADSVFFWMHDGGRDHILQASSVDLDSTILFTNASINEISGNALNSYIEDQEGETQVHFVYDESFREELLYGFLDGDLLTISVVDSSDMRIADVAIQADLSGNPFICYSALEDQELRFAAKIGDEWSVNNIVSGVAARDIQLAIVGDSVHILYFDGVQRALAYTRGAIDGESWVSSIVDNSTPFIGQGVRLAVGENGTLHIAYLDPGNQQVKFAVRTDAKEWVLREVTASLENNPSFPQIVLDSLGRSKIMYFDATDNTIFLAEQISDTTWTSSIVINDPANTISGPISLALDAKERPWILYNSFGTQEELRLLRKSGSGDWRQVSVGSTRNELSSNVNFHIVGDDIFVLGKKNRIDDEGIGLLRAREGVTTDISSAEELGAGISLAIWPNPATDRLTIALESDVPEKVRMDLINVQGKLIQEILPDTLLVPGRRELSVALNHVSPGMYVILIATSKGRLAKRLMITQ